MHVDTGLQSLGLNREAPAVCDTGARNLKPIEYHEPMQVKEKAIPFLITSSRKPEKVGNCSPIHVDTGLQSLGLNREAPAECDTGARNLKPIEYHEPMRVKEKAIPFLITSSRKPEKVGNCSPIHVDTGLQSLGLNREAPAECDTGARNLKPIEYHEPMRVKEKAIPFLIISSRKPEKVHNAAERKKKLQESERLQFDDNAKELSRKLRGLNDLADKLIDNDHPDKNHINKRRNEVLERRQKVKDRVAERHNALLGSQAFQRRNTLLGSQAFQRRNALLGSQAFQRRNALLGSQAFQRRNALLGSQAFQRRNALLGSQAFQRRNALLGSQAFQRRNALLGSQAFQRHNTLQGPQAFQRHNALLGSPAFQRHNALLGSPAFQRHNALLGSQAFQEFKRDATELSKMKQTNFHLQEKKYSTSDRQKSSRPVKDKHVEFSETVGFRKNNVNYRGIQIRQPIPEDQSALTDLRDIQETDIGFLNNNLTQDIELDENGRQTNELGARLTHVSVSVPSTTRTVQAPAGYNGAGSQKQGPTSSRSHFLDLVPDSPEMTGRTSDCTLFSDSKCSRRRRIKGDIREMDPDGKDVEDKETPVKSAPKSQSNHTGQSNKQKQTNFHLQEKKYSTSDRQKSLRPVKDKHVEFSETVGFPENNVNYGGNRIPQLIPEDQSTLTDSCNIREMEIRCLNNNLTQDIELDENGPRTNELGPRLTHFEKRRRAMEERKKWQELLQPSVLEILDLQDQRDLKKLQKRVQLQRTGLISICRYWNKLDEDVKVLLKRYDSKEADEIDNQSSETSFLTLILTDHKLEEKLEERVQCSKRAIGKLLQAFDRECRRNAKWNAALKDKAAASLSEVFHCVVCLGQLEEPRLCPQCSSLYCDTCIQEWLANAPTCPHCRADLNIAQLVKCAWAEDVALHLDNLSHAVPRLAQRDNDRLTQEVELLKGQISYEKEKMRRLRDENDVIPKMPWAGLDETEKTSSHGWSSANRFGQSDMDNSQSNLCHQLITQNNSDDVPDAPIEEEIGYQESAADQSQLPYQQSPVSRTPSRLKQHLPQNTQKRARQQHVTQQVRNFAKRPVNMPNTQQKPVYSVVHSTDTPRINSAGNQKVSSAAVNQSSLAQAGARQSFSQAGSQREDPNCVAICQFCGCTSIDKLWCDSCCRKFTSATKLKSTKDDPNAKRRNFEMLKDGDGKTIDKKMFYAQKLEEQNQVYTKVLAAANNPATVLCNTRILMGRPAGRGRGQGSRRLDMPETVTISSDEDETSPTKTTLTPHLPTPATQAQTHSIQSSQVVQASLVQAAVSSRKSPAAGTPGECPESPLIPTIPISTKRTASSRLQKMEDENGKLKRWQSYRKRNRPGAPMGPLEAEDIRGETLTLNWKPPKDNGGEKVAKDIVEKKRKGTYRWSKVGGYISTPTCDVRNLEPGEDYEFRVMAENSHGLSEPLLTSEPILAKLPYNKPGPPGTPKAKTTTEDSITMAWKPPSNDGGNPISGYVLEKKEKGDRRWQKCSYSDISDTEFTARGLTEGKEYEFRVAAVNHAGVGEFAETTEPIKARPPPDAPTDVTPVDIDEDSVTLNWNKPKNEGGKKIQGYVVEYKEPTSGRWKTANNIPVSGTEFKVPNLDKGTKYEFRVRAKNQAGLSEPSRGSSPVTCKPKYTRPFPPGIPQSTKVGRNYAELEWEPPRKDGGSKITGYLVEKKPKGSDDWQKVNDFPCIGNSMLVPDLVENSDMEFRVMAVNAAGPSEPSGCSSPIKIKEKIVGNAPEFLKKLSNTKAPRGGEAKFVVQADGKPTPEITWYKNGIPLGNTARASQRQSDDTYTLTLSELDSTDKGVISCEMRNNLGTESCKCNLDVIGVPGAPVGPLNVSDITKSSCSLRWKPPTEDGGSKIVGYQVDRQEVGKPYWSTVASRCKDTSIDVQGLYEGNNYLFRVSAVNDVGVSKPLTAENPIVAKMPYETVTISSDEDETSPTKTTLTPHLPTPATQAQTHSIQSSQGVQASLVQAAVSSRKSPAAGTPGECPESPLIPTIPISTKRTASSRLQKMEDEDPNCVAICQFCGYTSMDKVRCESCYRKFTSATKFKSTKDDPKAKRRKLEMLKDGDGKTIDKKMFYTQKLEEQNQVYTKVLAAANNPATVLRNTRILRGRPAGRGRGQGSRRQDMPETVTISSDEDETSPTKTTLTPHLPTPATQAQTHSIQSSQVVQASLVQAAVSSRKSPAAGTPGECPESPLIPTIPISTKRTASSRLQKMEDEFQTPRPGVGGAMPTVSKKKVVLKGGDDYEEGRSQFMLLRSCKSIRKRSIETAMQLSTSAEPSSQKTKKRKITSDMPSTPSGRSRARGKDGRFVKASLSNSDMPSTPSGRSRARGKDGRFVKASLSNSKSKNSSSKGKNTDHSPM